MGFIRFPCLPLHYWLSIPLFPQRFLCFFTRHGALSAFLEPLALFRPRTRHPESIGEGSFASPLGHTFPQAPRPAPFHAPLPARSHGLLSTPRPPSRVHRRGIFRISSGPCFSSYPAARALSRTASRTFQRAAFHPAPAIPSPSARDLLLLLWAILFLISRGPCILSSCFPPRTRHPKSIGEESYAPPLGHAFPQAPRPALSFRLLLPTARALSRAAPRTFLRAAFRPRTRHPESIGEGSFASPLGRAFLIPRGSHLSPPSAVRPQSNTPVSGLFTMGFCRSKRDSISTFAPASLLRAKAVITSNTWYVCL